MSPFEQGRSQEVFSKKEVELLGFDPEDYLLGTFAEGDTPQDRHRKLLSQPGSEQAREKMLINVRELDRRLSELDPVTADFDIVLRNIILEIAKESGIHSEKFINNLNNRETGLFYHLDEISEAMVTFADGISRKLHGVQGELLTQRQLDLMDFVARTHDLAKLLGGLNAQIDPDHEVIYRKIIGKYLVGKKFKTSRGGVIREITFTKADKEFCIALAGHHEDIYREEDFAGQVRSFDMEIIPAVDTGAAVERARMIFHFIDIFGNALGFDNKGFLIIKNQEDFQNRFIDLYRRHINLPIMIPGKEESNKETNWPRAKAYRPQWGLHGVAGLTWTFEALRSGWGIKVDQNLIAAVQLGIKEVLNEAIRACDEVLSGNPTEYVLVGTSEELLEKRHSLDAVNQRLLKEVG